MMGFMLFVYASPDPEPRPCCLGCSSADDSRSGLRRASMVATIVIACATLHAASGPMASPATPIRISEWRWMQTSEERLLQAGDVVRSCAPGRSSRRISRTRCRDAA